MGMLPEALTMKIKMEEAFSLRSTARPSEVQSQAEVHHDV